MTADQACVAEADLASIYRDSRERLGELVRDLGAGTTTLAVDACPGWSVHDVVAHLVAVAEDVLAGGLMRPPTDDETAAQVARRHDRETSGVIKEWATIAPAFEALINTRRLWPGALDALCHEHDVRAAMQRPGAREVIGVTVGADYLVSRLRVPVPLIVRVGEVEHVLTTETGTAVGPTAVLQTDSFEAFRFRLGRRSRAQLEAMDWSGDPMPVLDHLCAFGPSQTDIVE